LKWTSNEDIEPNFLIFALKTKTASRSDSPPFILQN
jgi:hypothetical protein